MAGDAGADFMGNEPPRIQGNVVAVPPGLFARARRNNGMNNRRRPVDQLLNIAEAGADTLTCFKVLLPLPRITDPRPIPTHCSFCYPNMQKHINMAWYAMGVRNCFSVPSTSSSWLPANFFHFWSKRDLAGKYGIISGKDVIEGPAFRNEFDLVVTQVGSAVSLREIKEQLLQVFEKCGVAKVSDSFLRLIVSLGGWLASLVFRCVFDAVCVHEGQIELLKSYSRNQPVIYVPVQRSHWDHFVLSWVLLDCDIRTPIAFSRRALSESYLCGRLAKLCGVIDWNSDKKTNSDSEFPVGAFAFEMYLRSLLKNRSSLEISVESHRSRIGNPGTVMVGTEILGLINKFVEDGEIEDAVVVPFSVNYEILPEPGIIGNYDKKSLPGLLRSLWILIRRNFGFVRVNFGHPVSVREFQSTAMKSSKIDDLLKRTEKDEYFWLTDGYCNPVDSKSLNWDSDADSVTSLNPVYADSGIISHMNRSAALVTDMLTCHILYDAWKSTVFMPTNLLAFVLLTKYRKHGVQFAEMEEEFSELVNRIRLRKGDVGFTSTNMKPVIERAVRLLGPNLVRINKGQKEIRIQASHNRQDLIELSYYGNPVVSFFVMEGIISTAIFALRGKKLAVLNGTRAYVTLKEKELVDKATHLSLLLKGQFLIHPPCLQLDEAIKFVIDKMRDEYLICYEAAKVYRDEDDDQMWVDPVADSERIQLKAVEEPTVYKKLAQLRDLILPYIKAYAVAFPVLYELLPPEDASTCDMPEQVLRMKMLEKLLNSTFVPPEIAVLDTVRNFIISLKHLGIIGSDFTGDGNVIYYVCDDYANANSLDIALNNLLSFYSF